MAWERKVLVNHACELPELGGYHGEFGVGSVWVCETSWCPLKWTYLGDHRWEHAKSWIDPDKRVKVDMHPNREPDPAVEVEGDDLGEAPDLLTTAGFRFVNDPESSPGRFRKKRRYA